MIRKIYNSFICYMLHATVSDRVTKVKYVETSIPRVNYNTIGYRNEWTSNIFSQSTSSCMLTQENSQIGNSLIFSIFTLTEKQSVATGNFCEGKTTSVNHVTRREKILCQISIQKFCHTDFGSRFRSNFRLQETILDFVSYCR